MKSLHWQIALSDPVITFPGAATQFALASFVRIFIGFLKEFLLVSYNFNTKRAFFKRTCKSGAEKEGRALPFQLNNLHRSCRSTWERKGKLEIIYPICLLHKSWNRPPWYSVLFTPKSFTCFSKALLQLPKGFHFQMYFWGGRDSHTIWFSRWQQNKGHSFKNALKFILHLPKHLAITASSHEKLIKKKHSSNRNTVILSPCFFFFSFYLFIFFPAIGINDWVNSASTLLGDRN